MHHPGKRKLYRGRYAGLSLTFLAKLVDLPRAETEKRLFDWLASEQLPTHGCEPKNIGIFITNTITQVAFEHATQLQ